MEGACPLLTVAYALFAKLWVCVKTGVPPTNSMISFEPADTHVAGLHFCFSKKNNLANRMFT